MQPQRRNLVMFYKAVTTIPVVFWFVFLQGPNNDIIFLELDLLETKCHILDPTPLANCTIRSLAEHVSI